MGSRMYYKKTGMSPCMQTMACSRETPHLMFILFRNELTYLVTWPTTFNPGILYQKHARVECVSTFLPYNERGIMLLAEILTLRLSKGTRWIASGGYGIFPDGSMLATLPRMTIRLKVIPYCCRQHLL